MSRLTVAWVTAKPRSHEGVDELALAAERVASRRARGCASLAGWRFELPWARAFTRLRTAGRRARP